ncbi:Breast cancer type 2 susceptibility protein like protein [Dufourea novaeangliae]|uniref:Breast cancer type 2 susceptibility protein like protein n=2 Tax=Dufourea novaeangliae TaxID=178035 RepID=A0A154PQ96_DUFNO|nr:Breast cancer type 2 susceptibility protein like protein [Dufourea novaeangliae]
MSNQFKKLQFSSEFQESRNVHGCSENYKKERNEMSSVSNNDTNNLMNVISKTGMSKQNHDIDENSLISHEITESTIALLADENSLGTFHEWVSPVHNEENEDVTNIPSSPVIGGQFISRKRKCVGVRKKTINSVKHKQSKLMHNDCTTKLNDNHVWSDQYIKEGSQESTDKENKYISTISNDASVIKEFDDMQFMLDFINESATILERRLQAAFEQDRQIKLKEKCKPKPKICKLYFNRRTNHSNRISWKEITKGNAPIPCTYKELVERKLPPEILDITAGNAVTYRFRFSDFYGQNVVQSNVEGIKLEDDACVILDENGYAGISEIKRSFLASSGVDPNLLPTGWLENHYRWIVWKLGSMDRMKFASVVLPRVLTPTRVMMELKYRYDREIDRSQRSALRKILEKDDVATKRMVLCVSSIIECDNYVTLNTSPKHMKPLSTKLTLTDGWYSVQAVIDQAMIKNIISGKLKEGTKLITYGSELLNCDQGCSPLEVPENACLRIHTNSTRRARWYTKLGYIAPTGPMCVKLKSISSNGGLIGRINVMIARIYPILYHEKTCSGESIFRNTRCEEKAGIAYERECRSMIEAFHAKTEKYFSIGKRRSDSNPDSFDLAAMEWTEDCEKLSKEEFLSMQEQESLVNMCRMKEEKFRQKLESRLQRSLPSPRQVTPVLKIRVIEEETSAILSIWSPNEEVTDILKEGNCISVCNITPSMRRNSNLQLTAGRNALFERVNISNKTYPRRIYTSLCDVNKPTFAPAYGEFDTVGIVSSVGNEPYGMKNFQAVYLAYPYTDSQSSYLSILFWHGISSHGYTEILTVGSSVACSNLEWRRATSWNVPIAYCTERSNFSRNPKQSHLQQPFEELKRLVTDIETYVVKCAAEISEEMQKKSMTRSLNTPDKIFSNEKHNSELQESPRKNLMNSSAKSVAIQKRLKKLQCYGETSPLSPIVLNNSSKRISLNFQSPIRTSNVKQMKVHVSLNTKLS